MVQKANSFNRIKIHKYTSYIPISIGLDVPQTHILHLKSISIDITKYISSQVNILVPEVTTTTNPFWMLHHRGLTYHTYLPLLLLANELTSVRIAVTISL